jgi:RNA polymerase sporulation-specific sigma factor
MEDYRTIDYKALIEKAQNGDKNATEKIIKENVGLVWSIVKKFSNRGYEADDLFQIGSIGLLKCIYKFDVNYEVKFSTYAVPMIMGEIKRFLRDDGMIKVSRPLKELSVKAKYAKERITQERGKEPTINELAQELKAETEDLILALEAGMEVESLYSAIYQGDGAPIYLIDKLEMSKDSNENLVDMIALKEIIKGLNPKERQVIIMRYFDDKTQTEVANAIGVSQVQVSRIERKVLNVIREKFA